MFEILNAGDSPTRGRELVKALYRGAKRAGVQACLVDHYSGRTQNTLMLYGFGGRDRFPHATAHVAAGGRLVVWDAGYWERTLDVMDRKYRVSIDWPHPAHLVMKGADPGSARWDEANLPTEELANDAGPIILVGNAPKSNRIGAEGWTEGMGRELRRIFPGRKLLYRPKPKRPLERDVPRDGIAEGPIRDVLKGAALVVCRHSNVAVDACRAGVPVVCEDGAAAAIYPKMLLHYRAQPSPQTRAEFLRRLAWWQWSPRECEAGAVWPWLLQQMGAA